MRRYESTSGKQKRFVELSQNGRFAITVKGIIGKTRVTEKEEWSDAKTATDEIERAIKRLIKTGYKLVSETEDVDPNAERKAKTKAKAKDRAALIEAIREDLDDSAAWLVYADALQADGDPRGELMVVQEKLARTPNDPALKRAEDKLFAAHQEEFFGTLLTHIEDRDPYRSDEWALEASWRNGFIKWAAIRGRDNGTLFEDDEPEDHAVTILRDLLEHPSALFIESIYVAAKNWEAYPLLVDLLTNAESPPPLRMLAIAHERRNWIQAANHGATAIDAMLAKYPKLHTLELTGDFESVTKLGGLNHLAPQMTKLEIERANPSLVRSLFRAKWPNLEKLVLWIGETSVEDLAPLMAAKDFPKLKHLGLLGSAHGDDVAAALATSVIASKLTTIDMSRGTLTGSGVRSLMTAKKKKKLSKLKRIELTQNYLSDDARAALAGICDEIIDAKQRFGQTRRMTPT